MNELKHIVLFIRVGIPMKDMSGDATIQVEIDSDLEPIIPDFFESRRRDCELLGRLLETDDLEEISRLGHRLKGAGGSYGFDAISEIGLALEQAAAIQDKSSIAASCDKLLHYLQHVRIVYG
ncbi:MAG: Hpt domain-containing protein [Geobacter sp.]|nr:MAG: Hpt domain-containing protein [Geobacter sp.]